MSRSNGPLNQGRGAPPPHWPAPEEEASAPHGYQVPPQPQPGRYQPQATYQPAPETRAPQPTHYQPPLQSQPPQPQPYYPAPPQQPSYQPQFDRYTPPAEPQARQYDPRALQQLQRPAPQAAPAPQPSHYDAQMAHAQAQAAHAQSLQAQVMQAQAHAAAQTAQAQPQRGYEQWTPSAAPRPQAPVPAPPQPHRDYDFANYARAAAPQQPQHSQQAQEFSAQPPQQYQQARQPSLQPQPVPQQPAGDQQWQLDARNYDRHGEPAFDPNHPDNFDPLLEDEQRSLQAAGEEGFEDDQLDYEEEEPRKGRRGLVMVSALVGAIALGGGMAYGYKTFMKPAANSAVIGKVSAPKGPAKTAPAEAGGKQFPNQDSKLAGRLGDGSAPAAQVAEAPPAVAPSPTPVSSPEIEGVKRVPTVVVGRDGTMTPPPSVPGMVVQQAPVRPPQPAPQAPPVAEVAPSPPAPVVPRARVAEAPQPRTPTAIVNSVTPEPAPAPPAAVKRAAAKKPPAQRDDLVASGTPSSGAATVPVAPKSGANGYVAVVASKGSRADAEKANADLEQRFDVLRGKVFDVQEADLTAQGKGMVYRSVVGPPGSRAFASGVCSQLKAVGYTDCWPTAY